MKIILNQNELKKILDIHFKLDGNLVEYDISAYESIDAYTKRVGIENRVMPPKTIGQSAVSGDIRVTTYLFV